MTEAGILAGTSVLEIAQNIAVPYCGRLLALMGADVVKLEPPGGDAMRLRGGASLRTPDDWGPEGKAYAALNVSKRSVSLDLADAAARPAVEALVRWADVVLLGLKPDDVDRYALGYDTLAQLNPSVVCLDLVPFGSRGDESRESGYDVLVQGRSGQSYVTARGHPSDAFPLNTRPAYNDFGTGMLSALGVVSALLHRERTGRGQRVETSLLGTAMAFLTPIALRVDAADSEAIDEFLTDLHLLREAGASFEDERTLYEDRVLPGAGRGGLYFRHYATSDGVLSVGALSPALFKRFHTATGLREGVRPATDEWREIVAEAEALFRTQTTDQWIARLRQHGVPAAQCVTPVEAMSDPQIIANEWIVSLEHPGFGPYTTTGMPVRFDDAPTTRIRPSPGLGHHSREVLRQAGLSAEQIDDLFARGVVTGR